MEKRYPIVGLASTFHPKGPTVINELNMSVIEELSNLAYKIGLFNITNEELESSENFEEITESFSTLLDDLPSKEDKESILDDSSS